MAITRDQISTLATTTSSGTTMSITWTTKPTAGTKVIIGLATFSGDPSTVVSSVVDNGSPSRTFTKAVSNFASTIGAGIWYADNVQPGSGTYTVTVTFSSAQTYDGSGVSYNGVATGAPTATNSGTGTNTSATSGNVTPSGAGALFVGAYSNTTGGTVTDTPLNSFTDENDETAGSNHLVFAHADKIDSGGPTATPAAWTLSATSTWNAVVAVWDAAAVTAVRPPYLVSQNTGFY